LRRRRVHYLRQKDRRVIKISNGTNRATYLLPVYFAMFVILLFEGTSVCY